MPPKKAEKKNRYLRLVKPKPFGGRDEKAASPAPPEPAPPDLIDASDFQSMRLSITLLASRSSGGQAQDARGHQIFGSAPKPRVAGSRAQVVSQITLSEFLDAGVVLDIPPPDFYEEGQVVYVLLKATSPASGLERSFSSNARVEGVSAGEDGALSVRLAFLKPDPQQWRDFREAFSDRQSEINDFLAAVRGR